MKKITPIAAAALSAALLASCAPVDMQLDTSDTADTSVNTLSAEEMRTITPELPSPDSDAVLSEGVYNALEDFCTNFLLAAAKKSDGTVNTLSSPLSAYFALAMAKEGAAGKTLTEMSGVMGDIGADNIFSLISALTTLEGTELNISNSIWVDSEFQVKASYSERLATGYLAEGFGLPLKTAEKEINSYIEEHTDGLIKDMLSDTALDDAVMAIVNTLYMKAKWQNPFSKEATHEREFTDAAGNKTQREFMYKTSTYRVIEDDNCIGVVLPYSDGSLEFVAVMPKDEGAPASDALTAAAKLGGWAEAAKNGTYERIKLYIPKFEQEFSDSLVDTLTEMGITSAFDRYSADFSGIAEDIFLQDVLQNAVLKLNEDGTEAAAATVVIAMATSARPPEEEPRTIEFNRPFSFAVIHRESGAVLFAGEHNIPVGS